jgi:hypothetical protein
VDTSTEYCRSLYLDLLKRSVLGLTYEDPSDRSPASVRDQARREPHNASLRLEGRDWPVVAPTMIGAARLDNVQRCIESVLQHDVPGDFIETGVWRGGAVIFMRGVLKAYGVTDRCVWSADSFRGLPPPNAEKYPHDKGLHLEHYKELAIPREEVERNFERYQLLDNQVRFLEGWFRDTLPTAPIERLALLRLDGDLYESTMDALTSLYDRLSPGGYTIIDDFSIPACARAVHDFRQARGIADEIVPIDWTGVFWRRTR